MKKVKMIEHMLRTSISLPNIDSCYVLADIKEPRYICSIKYDDKISRIVINIDDPVDSIVKHVVDSVLLEML